MKVGHNNPPDEYQIIQESVEDLMIEAKNWADGQAIETEKQSEQVSSLIDLFRKQNSALTKWHKGEKEPFLLAGREVDAKKKGVADKITLATNSLKKTLTPWLEKIEAEKRAEEEEKRKEAEEAARKAQEAVEAAKQENDLEALEAREEAIKEAKKAENIAKAASKDKAKAGSSFGRAKGLRLVVSCKMNEPTAALIHYKDHPRVLELLQSLALQDIKAGKTIPGFERIETREAV